MSRISLPTFQQAIRTGSFFLMLMALAAGGWAQSAARGLQTQTGIQQSQIIGGATVQKGQAETPPFTQEISPEEVQIFPNPAYEGFYVLIPEDEQGTLILTDLRGDVMKIVPLNEYKSYVETVDLEAGYYVAIVKLSNTPLYTVKVKVRD